MGRTPDEPLPCELDGMALSDLLAHVRSYDPGDMASSECTRYANVALDGAKRECSTSSMAAKVISALSELHGLRCDVGMARQAGLVIGSMTLLKSVFASHPVM